MKKIKSIVAALSLVLISQSAYAAQFSDISGHWAEKTIDIMASKKIVNGYEDGTFRPDRSITREEAAVLAYKSLNPGKETMKYKSDIFRDVQNSYSVGYIDEIANRGIIFGYDDGTFRPRNNITREEFAVIIYRIARNEGKLVLNKKKSIGDIDTCEEWAKEPIKTLIGNGKLKGFGNNTFVPKKNLTRAEGVQMLYSALYADGGSDNGSSSTPSAPGNNNNPTPAPAEDGTMYCVRNATLKLEPNSSAGLIGKNALLKAGTEVLIEGELGDFYLVKPKGVEGAFRGYSEKENFSSQKPDIKPFEVRRGEVIKAVQLLKEPNPNSAKTDKNTKLAVGAEVDILDETGIYYLIKPIRIPNAEAGYALKSDIE